MRKFEKINALCNSLRTALMAIYSLLPVDIMSQMSALALALTADHSKADNTTRKEEYAQLAKEYQSFQDAASAAIEQAQAAYEELAEIYEKEDSFETSYIASYFLDSGEYNLKLASLINAACERAGFTYLVSLTGGDFGDPIYGFNYIESVLSAIDMFARYCMDLSDYREAAALINDGRNLDLVKGAKEYYKRSLRQLDALQGVLNVAAQAAEDIRHGHIPRLPYSGSNQNIIIPRLFSTIFTRNWTT